MEYKLKKDYISAQEIKNLTRQVIEIYCDGDLIDGYKYNPVDAEINFFAGLFYLTIEGYETSDNKMFNELFNDGVQYELLDKVRNADMAYDLVLETMDKISNPLNNITEALNNIPSINDIEKELNNLKDGWEDVSGEYKEITGKKK